MGVGRRDADCEGNLAMGQLSDLLISRPFGVSVNRL
jgi:hypothetical protein